jgi:transposase
MTVAITRHDYSAEQLRAEAGRCKDGPPARRMLAIAHVLDGARRGEAAALCGMDRQTLRDWVHRYNAEGVPGLPNRPPAGGPVCRLTPAQQVEFAGWVEAGPDPNADGLVRWRRQDLQQRVAARFGVHLHQRTLGKVLTRLGFSHVSVRPQHPKADAQAQQAHKKTSRNSLRTRSPKRHVTSPSNSGGRTKPCRPARHTDRHLGQAGQPAGGAA